MRTVSADNICKNDFTQAATDHCINYPCCKSFDGFIDSERLRSLDEDIRERTRRHTGTRREDNFVNFYRLDAEMPYKPGVREIWLSRTRSGLSSKHLGLIGQAEFWELMPTSQRFVRFRTNLKKPFYDVNQTTGVKKYVESYAARFDTVNQYHGSDACEDLSFGICANSCFTNEFREVIPRPDFYAASKPAWRACLSGENG